MAFDVAGSGQWLAAELSCPSVAGRVDAALIRRRRVASYQIATIGWCSIRDGVVVESYGSPSTTDEVITGYWSWQKVDHSYRVR